MTNLYTLLEYGRKSCGIEAASALGLMLILLFSLEPARAQYTPVHEEAPQLAGARFGSATLLSAAADATEAAPTTISPQQGKAAPPERPGQTGPPQKETTKTYQVNGQITWILQNLFRFHSPYERVSQGTAGGSLLSRNESEISQTYTLFLGARLNRGLEFYIDPEMARGHGISSAVGLAGYTNGEVIRNGGSQDPYLARYYLRYTVATGKGEEKVEPGQNQVAGTRPVQRLVVWAGKLSVPDIFDINSYANNTRTQFTNWALLNNGAYDYAADVRGYTLGMAVEWIHPDWAIRLGSFQMPTMANGPDLAGNIAENRGDNLELELHPNPFRTKGPAIVRLLAYRNLAHMGNYDEAIALAKQTGTTPDITKGEHTGNVKYGFGLNFEIPLGDFDESGNGQTGLFGRYGWNDGATESFAYTEIDRTTVLGGQMSGARWRRPKDHFALALVQNDLSSAHKDYLAAGGAGFLLGDGKLTYGPEQILETYYSFQANASLALTLDYQYINNPGYNQDRGPVSVLSFRAHVEF